MPLTLGLGRFCHRLLNSCSLSSAESNYDAGKFNFLTVKLALEEWRHWLEGAEKPFVPWTDHKNLAQLQSAKRLNSWHRHFWWPTMENDTKNLWQRVLFVLETRHPTILQLAYSGHYLVLEDPGPT